ncbi:sensor histidine kinase [Rothia sp. CCM 9417]|uniref:sensor histidine kinase n=1 Tax=Rothia sp. CCM 9417 TaxID=3402657 RepID=UPI003AE8E872
MESFLFEPAVLARRKRWVNGIFVALCQLFTVGFTGIAGLNGNLWWLYMLLWAVVTGSLYFRYSRPKTVTVLVLVGLLVTVVLPFPALDMWWVAPLAVYHWARYGERRVRIVTIVLFLVASVVAGASAGFQLASVYSWSTVELLVLSLVIFFFCAALCTIAWFLGDTRRLRDNRQRSLVERNRQLVHEREQERVMAALDERARIAREMHDIVAHSLSVIITQADGARYVAQARQQAELESSARGGEQVEPVEIAALGTISETARSSLQQMRSLLGVLRTDEGAAFQPLPALHNVPQLVDQMQELGFNARLVWECEGVEEKLPQGAELTVYRIVQEALTNVRKHSPTTPLVTVTVREGKRSLDIDVVNAPQVQASEPLAGARRGLLGMRERVDMYRGSLHYGRLADGSFRVFAQIPFAP